MAKNPEDKSQEDKFNRTLDRMLKTPPPKKEKDKAKDKKKPAK